MTRIIVLSGPKGAGKDTVARYLITRKGYTRYSFADRMREVASIIYDIPIEAFRDPVLKNKAHPNLPEGKTLRNFMEFLGEDLKRFDPLLWIKPIIRSLSNLPEDGKAVVTDLRFPVELKELQALTSEFYYVYRPQAEAKLRSACFANTAHISERHCLDYKKQFTNIDNLYHSDTLGFETEILSKLFKE